jgi:hypothetical protein
LKRPPLQRLLLLGSGLTPASSKSCAFLNQQE